MNDDPYFENSPPTEARGELNPPPRKPPTAVGAAAPPPPPGPGTPPLQPAPMIALGLAEIAAGGVTLFGYGVAVILVTHHVALIAMGVLFAAAGLVVGYFALGWRRVSFGGHRGWHILRTRFGQDLRTALRTRFSGRGATRRSPPA